MVTTFFFMIWMTASALAPNWAALNVFRLLNGFFAAGLPSTISGVCADLYSDNTRRGYALLGYNIATQVGSVLGPIISGWAVNWRLSYGIGLGYGFICCLGEFVMPETNPDIILDRAAKQWRSAQGIQRCGPRESQKTDWQDFMTKVLVRPLIMFCKEPLVLFTCIYLAFQYGIFYVFLQSYPIIFEEIYGFSTGQEGLIFLGIGAGIVLSIPAQYMFEMVYERASERGQVRTKHHGASRLPPACASGPLIVLSLFWSAWTSKYSIHWIWSALSGVSYGLGYILNFNALLNYLIDSYTSYASSANAASSLTRRIMGAALPFATVPMYHALGVHWASSLLGFVAAIMSSIPFVFWMYGEVLLEKSKCAKEPGGGKNEKGAEDN